MKTATESVAERYDHALHCARHYRLLPDSAVPKPTAAWPPENIALLERYRDWLSSSGASQYVIDLLYIPMAGHVLGLNLKPYEQLDLDADLEKALAYIKAKRLSAEWTDMCRNALLKFRLFLRQQRDQHDVVLAFPDRDTILHRYCTGLPDWLIEQSEHYQHIRQRHWRPARMKQRVLRFWSGHTRLWRWLFERYPITCVADVKRQYVLDFIDHRLTEGIAVSTINQDLRAFHIFLLHLQEQDHPIPQVLLRIQCLKQPDRLPRFLTDDQVRALRDDFEQCVIQARSPARRRDALLDRAAFYLLWQGGLRCGELEELCMDDLDLNGRKLMARQGKGRKDRSLFLTDTAVRALNDYLQVHGMGPTNHVFFYRNRPLCKDLVRDRIKAAGRRVGVKATPHCLRHTFGTQLLNAGCRATSIQKLLGHRSLNSTMIYARVHDHTVAADYYAAMARIEKSLDASDGVGQVPDAQPNANERGQLLALLDRLADPQISLETRLDLVEQMRHIVVQ